MRSLGGPGWFQLGDSDLALHVLRTSRLEAGQALSAVTAEVARAWGVSTLVLPATDDPLATMLETDVGTLEFQKYFVELGCAPVVRSISFEGAQEARPAPGVVEAIAAAEAVIIAPSNPYLSVDPVIAVRGVRVALGETKAPVVAVSPLIAGRAVKGPTAKLMAELGVPVDSTAIAAHYEGLIDALLIDNGDDVHLPGVLVGREDILMVDHEGRARVAGAALALSKRVRK